MGVRAGTLKKEAAVDLGCRKGFPVGEGGADAFVGMIGLDVVSPKNRYDHQDRRTCILALVENELHSQGMWGSLSGCDRTGTAAHRRRANLHRAQWSAGFNPTFAESVEKEARDRENLCMIY